ncbi:MAG: hypothetical protein HYX94_14305 [Chloroflexi bacterium]|nr:hypothetical protein [Chloroflexota bacterium]
MQDFHRRWGFLGATEWARWEGQDRNRRSIEIDVVARLYDYRLLAGEVEWSIRPVGLDLHLSLSRNLDDLARSGRGWAADALSDETSACFIYFSAGGFTDDFRRMAREHGRIHLITLEDLYPAE